MNRTIKTLVDMGEDFEAELLAAEMGVSLDKLLAGELPTPQKPDEPTQVLSLFGGQTVSPEVPTEEEG